jgi:hypothetical protein
VTILANNRFSIEASSTNTFGKQFGFKCENYSYTPTSSTTADIDPPNVQIEKDPSKADTENHLGGGDCIQHELDRFGTQILGLKFDARKKKISIVMTVPALGGNPFKITATKRAEMENLLSRRWAANGGKFIVAPQDF